VKHGTIESRDDGSHLIIWDDGVEAVVFGTWEQAAMIEEGRTAYAVLKHAALVARTSAEDLRQAADMADIAAINFATFMPKDAHSEDPK
jgi:hypothetical protein